MEGKQKRPFRFRPGPWAFLAGPGFMLMISGRTVLAYPQYGFLMLLVGMLWLAAWVAVVLGWAVPRLQHRGPMLALVLTGWGLVLLLPLAPWQAFKQAIFLWGMTMMAALGRRVVDRHHLSRHLQTVFLSSLFLMALTPLLGTGAGARLWLGCCGVYVEPSSLHKTPYLAWMALTLSEEGGLLRAAGASAFTLLFTALQGDLGALFLYLVLSWNLLIRHPQLRRWQFPFLAGMAVLLPVWLYVYRVRVWNRLVAWWFPYQDPLGRGYQVLQARLALCAGRWWGHLPLQQAFRVPLVTTDLFYALLAEAWGWVGALTALLLLGGILGWTVRTKGPAWVQRLAQGLALWWGLQAFLVCAGALRLLPLTGMPFPFLAYGGSELTAAYAGLYLLAWRREGSRPRPRFPRLWLVAMALLLGFHVILLMRC